MAELSFSYFCSHEIKFLMNRGSTLILMDFAVQYKALYTHICKGYDDYKIENRQRQKFSNLKILAK